ncbi:MAG: periplasmic heavy metal sensor [Acidobacteriota bacterium]
MKKVTLRQLAPATALLFTLGVALASAQDGRHGHGSMGMMGGHGFGMRGLGRLDLTESQKADVKRIMESRKATFDSLRERARGDWQALHDLSEGSSPDRSAVGAAFLKLRADREALRAERQSAMQEVRTILTTEQKDKLDTLQQERKERFGRRGMQGGPGR